MTNKVKNTSIDERIIRIEDEISIRNAGEISRNLQKNLKNVKAALVKLDHIEQLDLSGIQIIHSLRKYAERKSIKLKIELQLSDNIKALLSKTGFNDFM